MLKALVRRPQDISIVRLILRSPFAMLLSLPIALLVAIDIGLLVGWNLAEDASNSAMGIAFLVVWPLLVAYLTWSQSIRIIWGKACMLFAGVSFFLPISMLIYGIILVDGTSSTLEWFAAGVASIIFLIIGATFGIFSGFIGWTLGWLALRRVA